MRQQYISSAERIVDAMLGESPALAQTAGDHTYDDCLPDWSPQSVAAHVSILRDAADAWCGKPRVEDRAVCGDRGEAVAPHLPGFAHASTLANGVTRS